MRKILFTVLICILFSSIAHAENKPLSKGLFNETRAGFTFEGAARNLQDNRMFYVQMKEYVDGATGLMWDLYLGNEIPSQPVAVIEILALMPSVDIEDICPRFFPEGTPDEVMDDWTAKALESLSAFRMVDPKKEAIRQKCLDNIVDVEKKYRENLKK